MEIYCFILLFSNSKAKNGRISFSGACKMTVYGVYLKNCKIGNNGKRLAENEKIVEKCSRAESLPGNFFL